MKNNKNQNKTLKKEVKVKVKKEKEVKVKKEKKVKVKKEKDVKDKIVKKKLKKFIKKDEETEMTELAKFKKLIYNDPFEMEHYIYEKWNKCSKSSKKTMLKEIGISMTSIKSLYGQLLMWIMNVIHSNKYSFNKKILLYVDIKNKKLNVDLENIQLMENDKSIVILYDYYFIILLEIYEILIDYMRQMYGVIFPLFDEKIKHKNENIENMIIISDFFLDLQINTKNFEYELCEKYYFSNKETIKTVNTLIFNFIEEELQKNINYYYEQVFISIGISI
jgi:hypothetical protein